MNVRRPFVCVEESIEEGTQWVVFESNGEPGQRGTSATMTRNDFGNGRLICLIGVSPNEPTEFVIFGIG